MPAAGDANAPAKRQFSPGLGGPGKFLYIVLRVAHMLFSFAILPACILYVKGEKTAIPGTGPLLWFVVAGAVLWAMLYIVLSQFAYPTTLWGALLATGGLAANGISGANLGEFNLFYAAYSTAWCALLAQGIFFWGILVVACVPGWQRRFFADLPHWYKFFLALCAASLSAFTWLLHRPFVAELRSETRLWLAVVYVAAFALQVLGEIRTLYTSSAIDNMAGRQQENVWNLFESYMPYATIGLIVSLLTALVTGLWQTGGDL